MIRNRIKTMQGKTVSTLAQEQPQSGNHGEDDVSRRAALISIGKYAAYVAPAMTVLVHGTTTLAGHSCSSPNNNNPPHSCIP
jgi:hypothetical protein